MKSELLNSFDDDNNKEISRGELLDAIFDGSIDEHEEVQQAVKECLEITNGLTDSFYDVLGDLRSDASLDPSDRSVVVDMYESLQSSETLTSL